MKAAEADEPQDRPLRSGPPETVGNSRVEWIRRFFPRARLVRWGASVAAIVVTLGVVLWLGQRGVYNLSFALATLPQFYKGFQVTIEIVGAVISLGFGVGFLVGWARTSRSFFLRGFGALYVDFFRSMPPIVLIAFAFLIGLLGLKYLTSDPFLSHTVGLWFGVIALGLHTAAYQAEIVRAGILSVPAGQTDAADSIGLSRTQAMFLVVLPQALRVSLPALGNEFSSVIKDTSLLNVIGWLELSGAMLVALYGALRIGLEGPITIFVIVGILYFVLTFAVNVIVRAIEDSFKLPGLEAARL